MGWWDGWWVPMGGWEGWWGGGRDRRSMGRRAAGRAVPGARRDVVAVLAQATEAGLHHGQDDTPRATREAARRRRT